MEDYQKAEAVKREMKASKLDKSLMEGEEAQDEVAVACFQTLLFTFSYFTLSMLLSIVLSRTTETQHSINLIICRKMKRIRMRTNMQMTCQCRAPSLRPNRELL